MRFTVLVHDAEEGGFWVEIPELPGALTQGETLEEVEANIREVLELAIPFANQEELAERAKARRWEIEFPVDFASLEAAPAETEASKTEVAQHA